MLSLIIVLTLTIMIVLLRRNDMSEDKADFKIKHIKSRYYKCGRDAACTILFRELGGGMYEYKFAICNHKDMFCKKKGVIIASNKTEIYKVWVDKGANLFTNILLHIGLGNKVSKEFDAILNSIHINDL